MANPLRPTWGGLPGRGGPHPGPLCPLSSRPLAHRIWRTLGAAAELTDDSTGASRMARLEAILFLAKEPLSSRKLSEYANLADGTEARTLVTRLNKRLDEAGRAFRVEQVAGGYQLVTRPKFAEWLRRLSYVPGALALTAPAMETLAVVAYCQPIPRAEVEAIRGVSCGDLLNQLMQRDLVRVGGRSEELGRPYLYQTTKRFLQVFGLKTLEDLPKSAAWRRTAKTKEIEPKESQTNQHPAKHDRAALTDIEPSQEEKTVTRKESDVTLDEKFPFAVFGGASSALQMKGKKDEDEDFEDEEEEFEDDDDDFDDDDDDEDLEDDDFEDEDEVEDEEELDEEDGEEFFEDEEELDEEEEEEELDEEEEDEWEEIEDEEELDEEEEDEDWDDEDWDDEDDWE